MSAARKLLRIIIILVGFSPYYIFACSLETFIDFLRNPSFMERISGTNFHSLSLIQVLITDEELPALVKFLSHNKIPITVSSESAEVKMAKLCQESNNKNEVIASLNPLNISYFGNVNRGNCIWISAHNKELIYNAENFRLDSRFFTFSSARQSERIKINEVYSVKREKLYINEEIASWSRKTGFELYSPANIWQRRSDLRGVRLTDVVKDWNNAHETEFDPRTGQIVSRKGYMVDVQNALKDILGFNLDVIFEHGEWGVKLPNGSWNGILQKVHN